MPPKKGTKRGRKVCVAPTTTSVASTESVTDRSNPSRVSGSEGHSSEAKNQSSQIEALQAELLRYQGRFGEQMWEEHAEDVHSWETPLPRRHFVETRAPIPPPPPPPFYAPVEGRESYPPPPPVHVQRPEITYWEALRHLKDMGMEMFAGESSPLVADNWRKKLERNLDTARCPADYRLDLAVQYLKDSALYWWEGVVAGVHGRYQLTWEDFRLEFSKKYFPREAMDEMESAFQDLRQGSRTIREYEMDFSRLRRFAGRYYDEQELIRRFLKGMRVEIRNRCSVRDYSCMSELVERAAMQEAGLAEEQKYLRGSSAKVPRGNDSHKKTWDGAQGLGGAVKNPRQIVCFTYNKSGHKSSECRKGRAPTQCYNCRE